MRFRTTSNVLVCITIPAPIENTMMNKKAISKALISSLSIPPCNLLIKVGASVAPNIRINPSAVIRIFVVMAQFLSCTGLL